MTEDVRDLLESTLPAVVDGVSDLLEKRSTSSPNVPSLPSTLPLPSVSPSRTTSPSPSVWDEQVKVKVFGAISADGKLKAVALGGFLFTLFGAILLLANKKSPQAATTQTKKEEDPPETLPDLTTNRQNIGKPIEHFKDLIPHLAYCGENILLWGDTGIGKTHFAIQWAMDFATGRRSSLFPDEQCTTPRHYVLYYAYELDEQMVRNRYGERLNQYENLQVIYALPLEGRPKFLKEDIEKRLEDIPDGSYVAIFIDTFKRAVGAEFCYDEKKGREFLNGLETLQSENKTSHNRIISNIVIVHKKPNGDGMEAPGCMEQFAKTSALFSGKIETTERDLELRKSNNREMLDKKIPLRAQKVPFLHYVPKNVKEDEEEDVKPEKDDGNKDPGKGKRTKEWWDKKIAIILERMEAEKKTVEEIAQEEGYTREHLQRMIGEYKKEHSQKQGE